MPLSKQRNFPITDGQREALRRLSKSRYVFKPTGKAVFDRMLEDAWAKVFPDEPFPTGAETTNGGKK